MEKEEHLKLPFLDIMVERLDNKPVFVVYIEKQPAHKDT
jgi:hypothetical protein